jgi:hypothetical protein
MEFAAKVRYMGNLLKLFLKDFSACAYGIYIGNGGCTCIRYRISIDESLFHTLSVKVSTKGGMVVSTTYL